MINCKKIIFKKLFYDTNLCLSINKSKHSIMLPICPRNMCFFVKRTRRTIIYDRYARNYYRAHAYVKKRHIQKEWMHRVGAQEFS